MLKKLEFYLSLNFFFEPHEYAYAYTCMLWHACSNIAVVCVTCIIMMIMPHAVVCIGICVPVTLFAATPLSSCRYSALQNDKDFTFTILMPFFSHMN